MKRFDVPSIFFAFYFRKSFFCAFEPEKILKVEHFRKFWINFSKENIRKSLSLRLLLSRKKFEFFLQIFEIFKKFFFIFSTWFFQICFLPPYRSFFITWGFKWKVMTASINFNQKNLKKKRWWNKNIRKRLCAFFLISVLLFFSMKTNSKKSSFRENLCPNYSKCWDFEFFCNFFFRPSWQHRTVAWM